MLWSRYAAVLLTLAPAPPCFAQGNGYFTLPNPFPNEQLVRDAFLVRAHNFQDINHAVIAKSAYYALACRFRNEIIWDAAKKVEQLEAEYVQLLRDRGGNNDRDLPQAYRELREAREKSQEEERRFRTWERWFTSYIYILKTRYPSHSSPAVINEDYDYLISPRFKKIHLRNMLALCTQFANPPRYPG